MKMNYLAHAYLSFGEPGVVTGNLISDFVKGRKKYQYPEKIFKGIELHRRIDEFTDNHEATSEAKSFFRPVYRLYAGAFIDIVYDHFLANDHNEFQTEQDLLIFTQSVFNMVDADTGYLPERFATLFPFMKSQNWLYNYRLRDGISKSFHGLVRRALYMDDAVPAFRIFNQNYERLQDCYDHFFPEVKSFAFKSLSNLQGD